MTCPSHQWVRAAWDRPWVAGPWRLTHEAGALMEVTSEGPSVRRAPLLAGGQAARPRQQGGGALPQRPILPLFGNTWGPILWLSLSPGLRQYDNHSTGVEIEAQREERDLGG